MRYITHQTDKRKSLTIPSVGKGAEPVKAGIQTGSTFGDNLAIFSKAEDSHTFQSSNFIRR